MVYTTKVGCNPPLKLLACNDRDRAFDAVLGGVSPECILVPTPAPDFPRHRFSPSPARRFHTITGCPSSAFSTTSHLSWRSFAVGQANPKLDGKSISQSPFRSAGHPGVLLFPRCILSSIPLWHTRPLVALELAAFDLAVNSFTHITTYNPTVRIFGPIRASCLQNHATVVKY